MELRLPSVGLVAEHDHKNAFSLPSFISPPPLPFMDGIKMSLENLRILNTSNLLMIPCRFHLNRSDCGNKLSLLLYLRPLPTKPTTSQPLTNHNQPIQTTVNHAVQHPPSYHWPENYLHSNLSKQEGCLFIFYRVQTSNRK